MSAILRPFHEAAALLQVRHDDVGGALLEHLTEAVPEEQVFAATDGRGGRFADIPHRVDVFRRHRLLEEEQMERLGFLRDAFAGRHVVAAVHVDGQIDAFVELAAHEGNLAYHVIDLAVARRPVHVVPAKRIGALVDVDLDGREPHVADLRDLGGRLRVVRILGLRIAVDADAVAHLAAEQLIEGQPQRLAGQIPQGDLHRRQRRDVLTTLSARKDAVGANPLEQPVDVQRVLADQRLAEHTDERDAAAHGISAFAVTDQPLVGVDADVQLIAMRNHFGRADVGDLQFRPAVWRRRLLDRGGERRQPEKTDGCWHDAAQQVAAGDIRHGAPPRPASRPAERSRGRGHPSRGPGVCH